MAHYSISVDERGGLVYTYTGGPIPSFASGGELSTDKFIKLADNNVAEYYGYNCRSYSTTFKHPSAFDLSTIEKICIPADENKDDKEYLYRLLRFAIDNKKKYPLTHILFIKEHIEGLLK